MWGMQRPEWVTGGAADVARKGGQVKRAVATPGRGCRAGRRGQGGTRSGWGSRQLAQAQSGPETWAWWPRGRWSRWEKMWYRPAGMAAGLERQTVKGTLEAESMVLGCTEPEAGTSPGVLRALGLDRGHGSQKCSWGALGTSHPGSPRSWPQRGHWRPLENLSGACLRETLHSSGLTVSSGT